MTRRNGWTGLLLAAVLAAAAGCGSDEAGSPAASDPPASVTAAPDSPADPVASDPPSSAVDDVTTGTDPCAALDTVDLDGLLGEPAGTPEPEVDDFGGGCTVTAADVDSRGAVVLRVDTNAAADNFENAREQFGVDAEIAGLGEAAFASGPMVVVLDRDRLVSVQAVRGAELGLEGVTQAELEAAVREVLMVLGGTSNPAESTPDAAPGSTPDAAAVGGLACTLLGELDIEGLIGEPVGAPMDEGDGSTDECVIEPENASSTAQVSLTIIDAEAAGRFAETEEMFGVDSTVEGLGDEAFHSGPVLAVLDGERAILLWIMGDIMLGANIDDADLEAAMTQVLAGVGDG